MMGEHGVGNAVEREVASLFRVGGVSAFVLVLGYLLTFPIYAGVGDAPPSGVEARLVYFGQHGAGWWAILGLMVFTDLLYLPIFLSLYQALKGINRHTMLLAVACMGLFVALDLGLTWTAYSTLITSGGSYAAAATDAQRAALVAVAGYPSAVLDSPLLGVYAILVPSVGFLLTGRAMLGGVFSKATAYLALAAGITGIAFMGSYFAGALAILRIVNALLATVWFLFVGVRLYGLGRRSVPR